MSKTPQLIAEACQNHNGSRSILKQMIHTAAEAGADYIKIQAIRSRELTYREKFEKGEIDSNGVVSVIKRPYKQAFNRLSKLDLSIDDEAWFVEECKLAGINSMITVFTRAAVEQVKDMGFDAVKIASYDCVSHELLKDVKRWWKRIVVSTGATYDHEVKKASEILSGSNFTFLHCVTIYPTPMEECNLNKMEWLRKLSNSVGWSDHTLVEQDGIWASKIALAIGAEWIERHFTILDENETKDGPVSITVDHLNHLREFADLSLDEKFSIIQRGYPNWKKCLGDSNRMLSKQEQLNRDYYRGRFSGE